LKIKIKYIEKLINAGIDFTHKNNDGKNILSYIDENPTFNDDIFINGLANIIFHTITNKILYDKTIKTEEAFSELLQKLKATFYNNFDETKLKAEWKSIHSS